MEIDLSHVSCNLLGESSQQGVRFSVRSRSHSNPPTATARFPNPPPHHLPCATAILMKFHTIAKHTSGRCGRGGTVDRGSWAPKTRRLSAKVNDCGFSHVCTLVLNVTSGGWRLVDAMRYDAMRDAIGEGADGRARQQSRTRREPSKYIWSIGHK